MIQIKVIIKKATCNKQFYATISCNIVNLKQSPPQHKAKK